MTLATSPDAGRAANEEPPRVWVLTSKKLGDNAQVLAIAEALRWPYEVKRLEFTGLNHFHFRVFGPSLRKVAVDRSAPLVPPWPDLVLTIGRRSTPVALWIRQQSGGKTKLVQVGQSRVGLDCFDLVVANPQYHLPEQANVLRLDLPLSYGNTAAIAAAATVWQPRFSALPRPWTALLVGGSTAPFTLDAPVARRMIEEIPQVLGHEEGSLLVTTSRRTSQDTAGVIEAGMPANGFFYRWTPEVQSNPYLGILGLADRFIVTGESISMLVEVVRQGKPLAIYPLPAHAQATRLWCRHILQHVFFPLVQGSLKPRSRRERLGDRLVHLGLVEYPRDFSRFHRQLIQRGLAVYLGAPFPLVQQPPPDELPVVVHRIKALFA